MNRSINCLICLLGCLISGIAAAQPVERIDQGLERIRAKYNLPALSAAIVTPGRITAIGAVGERAKDSQVPVTIHDQWHMGSCTKAMTATLLARVIDKTALTWDTSLEDVFGAAHVHPELRGVTVRQLLGHRSGIPRDVDYAADVTQPIQRQRAEVVQRILSQPPLHPPGSAYLYSNAAYVVAGHIAERAGDQSWEELMVTGLWKPLKMTRSGFGAPPAGKNLTQPIGHNKDGTHAAGQDNYPVLGPAGTAYCTLSDWGRFIADLLQGRKGESDLLSKERYEELHQPLGGQTYALGWGVGHNGTHLAHAGSNNLWLCTAFVDLKQDYAILITTNVANDKAHTAVNEVQAELIAHQRKKIASP